jgi:malate synthase
MADRIDKAGLKIAEPLVTFIETRVLPGTGLDAAEFWQGMADIYQRFAPENAALLDVRDDLQARIDAWHDAQAGTSIDQAAYQAFLREIGYLVDEPAPLPAAMTRHAARR